MRKLVFLVYILELIANALVHTMLSFSFLHCNTNLRRFWRRSYYASWNEIDSNVFCDKHVFRKWFNLFECSTNSCHRTYLPMVNASFIYLYNIVYASQCNTIFKCFTFYASQQSTLFTSTKYNVPIKQHTGINYSVV